MSRPAGAMSSPYGDGAQEDLREHYAKMANAMATGTVNEATPEQPPTTVEQPVFAKELNTSAVLELIQTNPTHRVIIEKVNNTEIIFSIVGQQTKNSYKITAI